MARNAGKPPLACGSLWPFSNFDKGQLLFMLRNRTGALPLPLANARHATVIS